MSHTVRRDCPHCGSTDQYRYTHRLWARGYKRHVVGGRRVRVLAASPVAIVRCRGCGVAFDCAPPGGRHRHAYALPVDARTIEEAERAAVARAADHPPQFTSGAWSGFETPS
jgi:hypothetical protein